MRWLYLALLFIALGLVGAFPALLLAYFFSAGQTTVAWQVYLIGAVLLASWLPLKAIIDSRVKGQPLNIIFPQQVNSLAVSFALVAFLFFIPVLYFSTFSSFLFAIISYLFINSIGYSFLSFPLALLIALLAQSHALYRGALQEKQFGTGNMVFMRFNDMAYGDEIILNAERQTPRPYESEILILPAEIEADEDIDNYADDISESNSSDS
jgi:hypothetical protein